jgi:predicted phosphodiesterase
MSDADDAELLQLFGARHAERVVYGHIHRPYVRSVDSHLTVANDGSVGLPYDGDWRASYLLIEDDCVAVRRVEYELRRELADIRASSFPLAEWLAESQCRGIVARPPQMQT